ncbi:MAG: hypothetical protein EAZ92_14700 [Candidatus Kapaibacterium sp.]|nr:MAG: hypothetical protein EAZ92_14700 [Candidatus Kapabacteria bacterium]
MNSKHNISAIAAFILTIFVGMNAAIAQDQSSANTSSTANTRKFSFGIFGGAALQQHAANFPEFSSVPVFTPRGDGQEPPNFGNVNTIGFALGILAEYKITPELTVGLRAGYAPQTASFLTSHQRRFGNPNGASELGTIQYSLATTVNTLGAEPYVKYFIWEGLHASLGARVNLVLSSSYAQAETLLSPTTGGFTPSFSKVANERTGEAIPDVSAVQVAGVLGIGYDVSLGDRLVITPEVSYSLGLIPVVANLSWRVNDLRGSISARIRF